MGKNTLLNCSHIVGVDLHANIATVFDHVMRHSTEEQLVNAVSWYPLAYAWVSHWSEVFSLSISEFAGIVAALSPMLSWDKNKAQAIELVVRKKTRRNLGSLMAYPQNVRKAESIFHHSEPLSILGGNKVRSFYANLLLDENAVTIDRHAIAIALYGLSKERSGQLVVTSKLYGMLAQAYRDVAQSYNVLPYVMQSATWVYKAQAEGKV